MIGRLGVCSWSLQPTDPEDLVRKVRACGLTRVQLALDPLREGLWDLEATRAQLLRSGIEIVSGMLGTIGEDYTSLDTIRETGGLRPDRHWEANLAHARVIARIAQELGLALVSFHAGFLPHESDDPERAKLVQRLRRFADLFAGQGLRLALETGQEEAATLLEVLRELDHPAVGVNFDPANMILYGKGDPIAALEALAPHVLQVHIKDALTASAAGTWGSEVPVGSGAVDWSRFAAILRAHPRQLDTLIEREAGNQRVADIATARTKVQSW
jgi:sugar phosphate isomerase/epimerase